jgi:hypothetical protein
MAKSKKGKEVKKISDYLVQEERLNNRLFYYMHRENKNFESARALDVFQRQKTNGYKEAKRRFKKNYLNSLNIDNQSLAMLIAAFGNVDDFISAIDGSLKDTLNEKISSNNSQIANDLNGLLKAEEIAKQGIDNFLKKKEKGQKGYQELNAVLQGVSEATKIIETYPGELQAITKLLSKNIASKAGVDSLIDKLQAIIAKKTVIQGSNGNTIMKITQDRLKSMLTSLQNILSISKEEITKQGNVTLDGTTKSFRKMVDGYFNNIFSTTGEYVFAKGMTLGGKEIADILSEIQSGSLNAQISDSLKGANVVMEIDDAIFKKYGQSGQQHYKTDDLFKGTNFSIKTSEGEQEISIDLGVSVKTYSGMLSNKETKSVAFISELVLPRIQQMFEKSERYYAYNTLGLVNQNNENYRALKQAILARNMDLFLSGLGFGTDDFSQYLLINGELYSIWEIVQDIEKYNEGSSNTPGYMTRS